MTGLFGIADNIARQRYFARSPLNFRGAALFRNSHPEIDLGTYSWKGSSRFSRVRIERRERRQNVVATASKEFIFAKWRTTGDAPGSAIPPIIAAPEITNGHLRFASGRADRRTDGPVVGQAANCFWTGHHVLPARRQGGASERGRGRSELKRQE